MTRRLAAAALAIGGCFSPTPQPGLPCSDAGRCPNGLACDPATSTCLVPGGDAASDAIANGDAADVDAGGLGWSTPVELSTVNSLLSDADPSLTADRLELFFASNRFGSIGALDIYQASRGDVGEPFDNVVRVAELSSLSNDDSPWISPDGLTIYFTSDRGGGVGRVYVATRPARDMPFAGIAVDSGLSIDDELNVALSADLLVAVVDRPLAPGNRELYQHVRGSIGDPWSAATHLDTLGSPGTDASPGLDATGLVVYFHSDRAGQPLDPQRARRDAIDEPFDPPSLVDELDVPGRNDGNPYITADETVIVFDSNRPGGTGQSDLYMATR